MLDGACLRSAETRWLNDRVERLRAYAEPAVLKLDGEEGRWLGRPVLTSGFWRRGGRGWPFRGSKGWEMNPDQFWQTTLDPPAV
ncbi:MAG: hypothetical protein JO110_23950 [Acetobacteraceae bacterium]|nr:hypothetical protein [Acetobacteraceae bacterium]